MHAETDRMSNRENGYTLVEFLIALTLFAIGILAVASMQISGIQGNATSKWLTQASTRTADRIEQLIPLAFDDADLTAGHHGDIVDGIYTISWAVTDNALLNNIKTISVTVRWEDKGLAKNAAFKYYKADL
jgi:type IV pilus assembly protein PilV